MHYSIQQSYPIKMIIVKYLKMVTSLLFKKTQIKTHEKNTDPSHESHNETGELVNPLLY